LNQEKKEEEEERKKKMKFSNRMTSFRFPYLMNARG